MRSVLPGVLVMTMAVVFLGGACTRESAGNSQTAAGSPTTSNAGPPANSNSPAPGKEDVTTSQESSEVGTTKLSDEAVSGDGDAMIVSVENDVKLRKKGKQEFVQIPGGLFRSGDLLRVGTRSAAWVNCSQQTVCRLGSGDFSRCCGDECQIFVSLVAPSIYAPTTTTAKAELSEEARKHLEDSEARIRALGADDITTQYLVANLYVGWKLKEASVEVDKFSLKMNDPKARQKLHTLYEPMMKRNGDLNFQMGNKGRAEVNYKKLTEGVAVVDPETKAAAHVSLGELYIQDGKKEQGIKSLEQGQKLYEVQGNSVKAATVRQSIDKVSTTKTGGP